MSHLLGGRVQFEQPRDGHRSGIEPVLLAASIPAASGEQVLEGGTGTGAALLCLAARQPGVGGLGLEIDPTRAAQATANLAHNGFDRMAVEVADLTAWRGVGAYDHAFANPPWHEAAGTPSPDPLRERARRGGGGLLAAWAQSLGRRLRHQGTLTFVVAATALPETLAAFATAECGSLAVLPLWPRAGEPAKLVLVRGRRLGRSPARLLPGLVLHEADGAFTPVAQAILRDGAALPL